VSFAAVRERRLDALGDLVADHLDTVGLTRLITAGVPRDLPALRVARESKPLSG
jgi:adenosylcobyric acid synthase